MKWMRVVFFVLSTILSLNFLAFAADVEEGTGLEVPPGTKIFVLVEDLNEHAEKIGLRKELILSKVELQLRRNGIPVGTREESLKALIYLYVNLALTKNAFELNVEFNRSIFYLNNEKPYSKITNVYHLKGLGAHSGDPDYIIQKLINSIDEFSNDLIKNNTHYQKNI